MARVGGRRRRIRGGPPQKTTADGFAPWAPAGSSAPVAPDAPGDPLAASEWRDMAVDPGGSRPRRAAAQSFIRQSRREVWEKPPALVQARQGVELGMVSVDGTTIRARSKAAGARKRGLRIWWRPRRPEAIHPHIRPAIRRIASYRIVSGRPLGQASRFQEPSQHIGIEFTSDFGGGDRGSQIGLLDVAKAPSDLSSNRRSG